MSSSNLKVVDNVSSQKKSKELEQLLTAFEIMGNRFQAINAQVAFDIKSSEMTEDTKIPSHAPANDKMGFETMGEFISAIGIEWSEWVEEVRAYEIRNRFNVSNSSDKAVIVQFNDVCKFLGREPYNAEDYHNSKDEMTKGVIDRLENLHYHQKEEHNKVVVGYETKISSMQKEVEAIQSSVKILESEKNALISEKNEVIAKHQTELNAVKTNFEQELEKQKQISIGDKEEALSIQKDQLSKKFEVELEIQIRDLNKEIEAKQAEISLLKSEMKQLKEQSELSLSAAISKHQEEIALLTESHKQELSDNYVPRFDYQAALIKLDQESKSVMSLLSKESAFEYEKEKMQSEIDELSIQFETYKNSYDNLNNKVLSGEVGTGDLDVQRITEILKSHDNVVYNLERYKKSAQKRKESIETKNNQLRKKDKKISLLKEKAEQMKAKGKKSTMYAWLFGMSALSASVYAGYLVM